MVKLIPCTRLALRIMMTKINWTHKNCTEPGLCLEFCGKNECLVEESNMNRVPEVEITRSLADPALRIKAFIDCDAMLT